MDALSLAELSATLEINAPQGRAKGCGPKDNVANLAADDRHAGRIGRPTG
jgi:hypothetical protein